MQVVPESGYSSSIFNGIEGAEMSKQRQRSGVQNVSVRADRPEKGDDIGVNQQAEKQC